MARTRLQLRQELLNLLTSIDPSYEEGHLYYRQPSSKMQYPCILYKRVSDLAEYADNKQFVNHFRYTITVIDTNPDSELATKVGQMPYTSFNREYEADHLNHFVYTTFY